jgi:hypothetical protein
VRGACAWARQLLGAGVGARDARGARSHPPAGDGAHRSGQGWQGRRSLQAADGRGRLLRIAWQDLNSAYELPTTAPSEQKIALVDAYDDPTAEADFEVYDEAFHLRSCTGANGPWAPKDEEWQRQTSSAIVGLMRSLRH